MKSKMSYEPGSHELVNSRVYVWPVQARLIAQQKGQEVPFEVQSQYMDTH